MQGGKSASYRLRDVFVELLHDRTRHGTASEEAVRNCERVLSHITPLNPRLQSYLKQIIEQASAERNLSTRIDWMLDEIDKAGGRSLNKREQLLLDQQAAIEDWLYDQADHFEEGFEALCNGEPVPPIASFRTDNANQPTAPPRRRSA